MYPESGGGTCGGGPARVAASAPAGACVHMDDSKSEPCVTVVGVMANSPFYLVASEPADQVCVPIESHDAGGHGERIDAMAIRTSGNPAAMIPTIRKAT